MNAPSHNLTTRTVSPSCRRRAGASGYSIVEVLVAAGILLIGVAGAAVMARALLSSEDANFRTARAINMQEQAATIFRMGVTPANTTAILLADDSVSSLTVSAVSTNSLDADGDSTNDTFVETSTCTLVIASGSPISAVGTGQTNTVVVVRRRDR